MKSPLAKFIAPKKDTNQSYKQWLDFASQELKLELIKMNDKDVQSSFGEEIHFVNGAFTGQKGFGPSKINPLTLNKLARSIAALARKYNWQDIVLGTSDFSSLGMLKAMMQLFESLGLNVHTFENPEMTLPELSYTIEERGYDCGVYLDSNPLTLSIKVLGEKGRLLKQEEQEQINNLIHALEFDFAYRFENPRKSSIIPTEFRQKFIDVIQRNMAGIITGDISSENRTIINTTSQTVYRILEEMTKDKQNIIPHLSNKYKKEAAYDISTTSSFREVYFKANKQKAKYIINIDGSGSHMSFAYKHNKTWHYLTSNTTFSLLLNKLIVDNRIQKGDRVATTIYSSPMVIEQIDKQQLTSVVKEELFASSSNSVYALQGDHNYSYSVVSDITSPEAMIPASILLSYFVEQSEYISIHNILRGISEKTHYESLVRKEKTFEEFKSDLKEIDRTKTFGAQRVKSMKVLDEDKNRIIVKIVIDNGYFLQKYSHISNKVTTVMHISSFEESKAFYAKREAGRNMKSIQNQDYLKPDETVSKKTVINAVLMIILLGFVLWFTFTKIIDTSSIIQGFTIMGKSFNTPFPYLLLAGPIIFKLTSPFLLWLIIRNFVPDIKFRHLLVATLLSSFIGSISVSFIFAPAFMLWFLRKKGYHTPDIAAALMLDQTVLSIFAMVLSVYWLGVGTSYLNNALPFITHGGINTSVLTGMAWLGFAWVSFNVFFYVFLAYSRKVHDFIFFWLEKGLFMVGFESRYRQIHEEIDYNAHKMRTSMKMVSSSPKKLLIIGVPWFIAAVLGSLWSSFSINVIAQTPLNNYWQTMTIAAVIGNANVIFPTPGGSGSAEWFGMVAFKGVIAGHWENFFNVMPTDAQVTSLAGSLTFVNRLGYLMGVVGTGSFFTFFMTKAALTGGVKK